jgi:hypothetical protein
MKEKGSSGQEVIEFLDKLEHPMKREIEEIRQIILSSNKKLTEHIKWNAPSFCIENEDRVTMKLYPPKNIQLIFHRGAKVKAQPKEKLISGHSSFLKWPANDRAVATFTDMDEIKSNKKKLSGIINEWIKVTT